VVKVQVPITHYEWILRTIEVVVSLTRTKATVKGTGDRSLVRRGCAKVLRLETGEIIKLVGDTALCGQDSFEEQ